MKPVVKTCVSWDILLRVPINVTKCRCVNENNKTHNEVCQIAIRLSVFVVYLFMVICFCKLYVRRRGSPLKLNEITQSYRPTKI